MLGQEKRRQKLAFNAAILTTFGKIDGSDINAIDGYTDRLESHLRVRYQWGQEEARGRVGKFLAELSDGSPNEVVSLQETLQR